MWNQKDWFCIEVFATKQIGKQAYKYITRGLFVNSPALVYITSLEEWSISRTCVAFLCETSVNQHPDICLYHLFILHCMDVSFPGLLSYPCDHSFPSLPPSSCSISMLQPLLMALVNLVLSTISSFIQYSEGRMRPCEWETQDETGRKKRK